MFYNSQFEVDWSTFHQLGSAGSYFSRKELKGWPCFSVQQVPRFCCPRQQWAVIGWTSRSGGGQKGSLGARVFFWSRRFWCGSSQNGYILRKNMAFEWPIFDLWSQGKPCLGADFPTGRDWKPRKKKDGSVLVGKILRWTLWLVYFLLQGFRGNPVDPLDQSIDFTDWSPTFGPTNFPVPPRLGCWRVRASRQPAPT